MEELILICEDSVEGILTAIYRIYEWKLCDKRVKIQTGASDLCLFAQYREVMPDAECAAKVARTLRRRFGEQAWEAISYALASEEADKSQAVYETVAAGLSGRIRGPLLQALAEPCIHRVFALSRTGCGKECFSFFGFRRSPAEFYMGRLRRMQTFLRLLCRILQTVSRWRIL